MENNLQPEIRFSGFKGKWSPRQLKDVSSEFKSGKSINSNNILSDGLYPVLGGNGLRGYTNEYTHEGKYALIGRQGALCGNMNISVGRAYFTEHAIAVRANENNDTGFLYFLLGKMNLGQYSGQSAQPGLAVNKLIELTVNVPSLQEQNRINSYFEKLDEAIKLQQQELETLKQTKRGFLQKMFPKDGETVPEVRFTKFQDDWVRHELGSLVDKVKSYSLSRDVETTIPTDYRYIHYGDIHTKIAGLVDESSNLPYIKSGEYQLLAKGDIVLADASEDYQGIATPAVIVTDIPYKLVAGLHTIALRPNKELVDPIFLYYMFYSLDFKKYGYRTGTGMKVFGISATNLLKYENVFPSIQEQTKIG